MILYDKKLAEFIGNKLSVNDYHWLQMATHFRSEKADLVIAPEGEPYLYRWHTVRTPEANVYVHLQVASDPERPLHDHPWDNMSVIISGGYIEHLQTMPPSGRTYVYRRTAGNVIVRSAYAAHRLLLPDDVPYTLTLFSTGPKVREWGYWFTDGRGWVHNKKHVRDLPDGRSVFVEKME